MFSFRLEYFVLNLFCVLLESYCDLIILDTISNQTMEVFSDYPANFGPGISSRGLLGYIVAATPIDGCTAIEPPPFLNSTSNITRNWFVLIKRYDCKYAEKVLNAQNAGFDAAIIYNWNSNALEPMSCEGPCDLKIPSVFVRYRDGYLLTKKYQYNENDPRFVAFLVNDFSIDVTKYLLPFAVFLGIGVVVTIVYGQERLYRMPSRYLKKIPQLKYKDEDPYEVCAVCLEEYKEGDRLRMLPCSHVYHSTCIDPWLTKKRRVCPICKRKIFACNEKPVDFDSDTEGSSSESEHMPLLRESHQPMYHSTTSVGMQLSSSSGDSYCYAYSSESEASVTHDGHNSSVSSLFSA